MIAKRPPSRAGRADRFPKHHAKIRFIYPTWRRIRYQANYILPPLGVTVVGALMPRDIAVALTDENVEPINFSGRPPSLPGPRA